LQASPPMSERPAPLPDDYDLMRGISAGDSSALKQLYDRHAGCVYSLCLRMIKDAGEAEQLLTDVFFEIWQSRQRYDEARSNPLTYLMRITRSRAIDKLRRRGPVGSSGGVSLDPAAGIDVATEESASAGAEMEENRILVLRALQSLDREQRKLIECAYYEGLSHSEIAEKFNKPLGTVKSTIRNGLTRLREIFSQPNRSEKELL
jgi:RNA polymerase sigma-70 factor, ECF subfamily